MIRTEVKSLYDILHYDLTYVLHPQTTKQTDYNELRAKGYWAINVQLRKEIFDEVREQIRKR